MSVPAAKTRKPLLRRALMAAAAGGGAWLVAWYGLPWLQPLPEALLRPAPVSTFYLAADGTPLRQVLDANGERSLPPLLLERVPKVLVDATLAAEDRRFFSHGGVDLLAVARAVWSNARHQRVVSGASTITQQLIKISQPAAAHRNVWVKVREALQARRLEMTWSKDQILAAYLNRIDYGNLFRGCSMAVQGYFDKPLHDLTPAEAAFLAALPQSPTRHNPFRNTDSATQRQKRILDQMAELGWLSTSDHDIAQRQPIKLQRFTGGFAAPHAVDLLSTTTPAAESAVRTTIDAQLQHEIETIIAQRLNGLASRHVTHAAAVVIDNPTGQVRALVGSRDFFGSDAGQVNGAWSPQSPGSAVKPFTYLLALERGSTPATLVADLPIEFMTDTGLYRPENYDHKFYGPMTLRTALGNSLNISAVRVLQGLGGPEILLDKLHALGLTTLDQPAQHYGLGLTIGNAPVRLLELANAYACLARLGVHKPWTLRVDGPTGVETRLFDAAHSYLIADILSDNQARLLTFGAWSPLRLPIRVAAKTGTSSSYRDNWTFGYTPEFTVGVWAGNFDGTPMQNVSGVTGAGPIFRDIFTLLAERHTLTWFEPPPQVVRSRIDPRNGRRLTPQSPATRLSRDEIFVHGEVPPPATPADYDPATGKAFIGPEYAKWITSSNNWLGDLVTCRSLADGLQPPPLRIVNPVPGTVIRLDPDLKDAGTHLLLQASTAVQWDSRTLKVESDAGHSFAILAPGRHEITAIDPQSNERATTYVIVRPDE